MKHGDIVFLREEKSHKWWVPTLSHPSCIPHVSSSSSFFKLNWSFFQPAAPHLVSQAAFPLFFFFFSLLICLSIPTSSWFSQQRGVLHKEVKIDHKSQLPPHPLMRLLLLIGNLSTNGSLDICSDRSSETRAW